MRRFRVTVYEEVSGDGDGVSIWAIPVRQDSKGDTTMGLNLLLWIVQGLLAVVFLFAGGMKLVLPLEAMTAPIALAGPFIRFLGVAEVLGAIGLILPALLRIRSGSRRWPLSGW
jgi:hypothetical protein